MTVQSNCGRCITVTLFLFIFLQSVAHAETIHYAIMQTGLKAGEASLTMAGPTTYKGKGAVLIVFKANGFNFLDEENIYLDSFAYKPLFVERNLNIFGQKEKIVEEYAASQGEVRITKTAGGKTTRQVVKKTGVADNIYALIFRYRKSGSFQIGDVLELNLPTKDLRIELVQRRPLRVGGKHYDSCFMQSKPAQYQIWFECSDKKLPLRISGAVGIANTVMVMTGYKE